MRHSHDILIRTATADDDTALTRLAALDSARVPDGPALIAIAGGHPRAAIELATGHVVADPFAPTTDLVELLRLRADRVEVPERRLVRNRRSRRHTLAPAP